MSLGEDTALAMGTVDRIRFCGQDCDVSCDRHCSKAWGINGRPRRALSDDPDDYVWLGDDELDLAPGPGETVGLAEGGHLDSGPDA